MSPLTVPAQLRWARAPYEGFEPTEEQAQLVQRARNAVGTFLGLPLNAIPDDWVDRVGRVADVRFFTDFAQRQGKRPDAQWFDAGDPSTREFAAPVMLAQFPDELTVVPLSCEAAAFLAWTQNGEGTAAEGFVVRALFAAVILRNDLWVLSETGRHHLHGAEAQAVLDVVLAPLEDA